MSEHLPSDLRVAVDGAIPPSAIDAPRLVLVRKLNHYGEPVGDFAYVAYWASDGDPARQDEHASYLARAVNNYAALAECAEVLRAGIHDGRLQSFSDRERFRDAARAALSKLGQL